MPSWGIHSEIANKLSQKVEKIIVGKTAGFCYGVKRAVEEAENEIKNSKEHIYCLGEIIHNKQVIENLTKQGIIFIEDINEAKGKTILRAHGVPKEIYEKARQKNIEVKDYTCPNVLKIHKIAEEYANEGYYIILTGAEKHPEVIGIKSYCGKNFSLIEKEDDVYKTIENFEKSQIKKLLIISQTTYSVDKFENITKIIKEKISKNVDLEIKNTICLATETRQKETEKLSKQVELMIIIGGKNSSNTKKLYEIAKQNCFNSISVENGKEAEETLKNMDLSIIEKVGIMAGASTPKESIDEVIKVWHLFK